MLMPFPTALRVCHRARPSYLEISNFFRSFRFFRSTSVASRGVQFQRRDQPHVFSLKNGGRGMRAFHQTKVLRSVQEVDGATNEMFVSYADSCTFFYFWGE